MIVDTVQFRALVAERDQLAAEVATVGEIRGAVVSIAESVIEFGDLAVSRWQLAPAGRGRARHARPRGGLRVVQGGRL